MFSHKLSARRKIPSAKKNIKKIKPYDNNNANKTRTLCNVASFTEALSHTYSTEKQCNLYRSASRRYFGEKQQTFKKHTVKIKDSNVYIRRQL